MLGGEIKPVHELTDEQVLALGFEVLATDLVRVMTYQPDGGGTCGWCVRATGNDQTAWESATHHETTEDLIRHTMTCEHNPLVLLVGRNVNEVVRLDGELAQVRARYGWNEADGDGVMVAKKILTSGRMVGEDVGRVCRAHLEQHAQLAAMTAARDEACALLATYCPPWSSYDDDMERLMKVGAP
jgi:hypothetical protein